MSKQYFITETQRNVALRHSANVDRQVHVCVVLRIPIAIVMHCGSALHVKS